MPDLKAHYLSHFTLYISLLLRAELAPISAANVTGIGLDTMEEEEEKNRFFAQLEAGASSTVDYSQLNRQWDSSSFTITADLRYVSPHSLITSLQNQTRKVLNESVRQYMT